MTESTEKQEDAQLTEAEQKIADFFICKINVMKDVFPGLPPKDVITYIDDYRFYHAIAYFMKNIPTVHITDGELDEITEDHVINALGHQGFTATLSDLDQKWEVRLNLKNGIAIVRDTHQGVALLRALYLLHTSVWSGFDDYIPILVKKWQADNNTTINPYVVDDMTLNDIANKLNVDLEEVERQVQEEIARRESETDVDK